MVDSPTYPQLWFTYGPRTTDDAVLRDLIRAGATGARFTFSYGTSQLQISRAQQVRAAAEALGIPVYLVADLQGEKYRLAQIEGVDEIRVTKDKPLELTTAATDLSSVPNVIPVQNATMMEHLRLGDVIVEGDGGMLLEVVKQTAHGFLCRPLSDGAIHPGRGLLVQSAEFRPLALTSKDLSDLHDIKGSKAFDAVAISFVSSRTDIIRARESLDDPRIQVFAKLETTSGIHDVESIAAEADGLVAARGDLALCMPWQNLYCAVKEISAAASRFHRPWILATQLVEGLERFAFPTRAEICDLSHWIEQGAFGAMLSYETAFGSRPGDAVRCVRTTMEPYLRRDTPRKRQI